MRIDLAWLRDPYRPGVSPVVQPWIQPRRHNLLAFRRYWPWLRLVATGVLIILAMQPMQFGMFKVSVAVPAVGFYLLSMCGFEIADRSVSSQTWRQHLGGLRKLTGLLSLMAVHLFFPAASTELWLLYLIPMLTLGVDLDRIWATCLIILTMILMFFSAWPFTDGVAVQADWLVYSRNGVFRAVISGYAGLTSYLLTRCLAYQSNTTRQVLNQLFDASAADRWINAPNAVAGIISSLLSEPVNELAVNVLVHEPALSKMKLIGSSTAAGEELASDGYKFDAQLGITGWAARYGSPCYIRDTRQDPQHRFLMDKAFPQARSALAVPVPLDSNRTAVLELESPIPNDVAYEDMQLMSHIASYLAAAHERSATLDFQERLTKLGTKLADHIIKVEEIGAMLEEIGRVALDTLNADIIRFYYRNPETDMIEQRRTIGALFEPDAEDSPVNDPDSLVFQLMAASRIQTFADALHDPQLISQLGWHKRNNRKPFVIRERVQSCAAMPLILGKENLGLMWVNYRQSQNFTNELLSRIQLIAPYAALAIKSGVQSVLATRKHRDTIRRIVHDSLSHRLHDVTRSLQELDRHAPGSSSWNQERVIVQCQVDRARRVVANLVGERTWFTLQSIIDDLEAQTQLIEKYYHIPVQISLCEVPNTPVNMAGGNELMFTCDEILGNVVRHSCAKMLAVSVEINQDLLKISVKDNGIGFDTNLVRLGQGIASIHDRIGRLGGSVDICSEPGIGTHVTITVPISEVGILEKTNVT